MKMQRKTVRAAVKRLALASLLACVAGIGWAQQQPLQFYPGHSAEKDNRRRAAVALVDPTNYCPPRPIHLISQNWCIIRTWLEPTLISTTNCSARRAN